MGKMYFAVRSKYRELEGALEYKHTDNNLYHLSVSTLQNCGV